MDFSGEERFWQGLFCRFYAENTGLACVISWAVGLFWVQVWTDRPFFFFFGGGGGGGGSNSLPSFASPITDILSRVCPLGFTLLTNLQDS